MGDKRSKQNKEKENEALRGLSQSGEPGDEEDRPVREEPTLTDRLNARLLLSLQNRLTEAQDGFLRRVQEETEPGESEDSNRRQEDEGW